MPGKVRTFGRLGLELENRASDVFAAKFSGAKDVPRAVSHQIGMRVFAIAAIANCRTKQMEYLERLFEFEDQAAPRAVDVVSIAATGSRTKNVSRIIDQQPAPWPRSIRTASILAKGVQNAVLPFSAIGCEFV